jgi:ABC-type nitrate/sulfonate/bicarbonate transport system permease component
VTAATAQRTPAATPRGRAPGRTSALAAVVALLIICVLWEVIARLSDGWVPGLGAIGVAFGQIVTDGETYGHLLTTLRRLAIAFLVATVVGVAIGAAMGFSRTVEAVLRPIVVIGLAIPDPVYFIFALLLLGTDEWVGIAALILAVIPFVVHNADTGVRNRDRGLDEMATVYRLSRFTYWTDVVGRQLAPVVLAAARTSLAFSWKIVVLMEALTQPTGIGSQIYYAFRLLRPAEMIAYAALFMILMRLLEYALVTPVERRLNAWNV